MQAGQPARDAAAGRERRPCERERRQRCRAGPTAAPLSRLRRVTGTRASSERFQSVYSTAA